MLKNIKVGFKIGGGFAVVLLLTGVMAWVAWNGLGDVVSRMGNADDMNLEAIGLKVNRLIRVGYGPFRLGELKAGAVEEVKPRVLRDQLGLSETPGAAERRPARPKRRR